MGGTLNAAHRLALRAGPWRWVIAVGAVIAVLGVMGILRFAYKDELRLFNLDGERNVPTTFTALVWLVISVLALLVGRASEGRPAIAWKVLTALTLVLVADELAELHEHLQFHAGIDWQILYAPIGVVAVVLWFVLARYLRQLGVGFPPFVGAAACVCVAEVFEALEINSHGDPRRGFRVMVVSEELLEMTAGLLLGLSLLLALRALTSRTAPAAA